jgi:hypothetical protein
MVRVITLPGGNKCRLGAYVAAWRTIKTLPAETIIPRWNWHQNDAASVLRSLRAGIHDRINKHVLGYGCGRKWDQNWQVEAGRAARAVNTPRLVVGWVPVEFRARLAHRLDA